MGMKDSDGSDSCPSEDEIENVLKNPVIADDNKLDISKSPSPKKSLKKLKPKIPFIGIPSLFIILIS